MYSYTWLQWLLFFYLYCFLGWVWESCYVSAKKRHWVNRGFLHLPLLPIYGSGAIVVLFVSLPIRDNPVLVYFAGAAAATVLELVVGLAMEQLFKVKYWDYSNQKFNYKGVICLSSTLFWGVLSVFLMEVAQKQIERAVLSLSTPLLAAIVSVISAAFIYDTVISTKAALDLAKVLTSIEQAKKAMAEELRNMEEKAAAYMDEAKENLEVRMDEARENFAVRMDEARENFAVRMDEAKENLAVRMDEARENIGARVDDARENRAIRREQSLEEREVRRANIAARMDEAKENIATRVDEARENLATRMDGARENMAVRKGLSREEREARREAARQYMEEYQQKKVAFLSAQQERLDALMEKAYKVSKGAAKRNPGMSSRWFGDSIQRLRDRSVRKK